MDSLISIYTTNAGRQGKYGLTHINLHYLCWETGEICTHSYQFTLIMMGDRGNMHSLISIYSTNAGRQGKYALTHINLHY